MSDTTEDQNKICEGCIRTKNVKFDDFVIIDHKIVSPKEAILASQKCSKCKFDILDISPIKREFIEFAESIRDYDNGDYISNKLLNLINKLL
jgi:hypothetical protein